MSDNNNYITPTDTADTGNWWEYTTPYYKMLQEPATIATPFVYPTPYMGLYKPNNNKKGDDDMRYLYEVILVNPKNDTFYINQVVARSETSAMMIAYKNSDFNDIVEFDDLKTSCRELMSWKKEKSLEKAIETIKEAVE